MPQPVPTLPTNVQLTNPYQGFDRGLFLYRTTGAAQYARIHAARWTSKGPQAAVGLFEFQVMAYSGKPTDVAQLAAGTVLKAPDGTPWFNCLVRKPVAVPILAEYWGRWAMQNIYGPDQYNQKLTQEEIDNADNQAQVFVKTMVDWLGIVNVQTDTSFNAEAGELLTLTSFNIGVDYKAGDDTKHLDITDTSMVNTDFDPVRIAIAKVKGA